MTFFTRLRELQQFLSDLIRENWSLRPGRRVFRNNTCRLKLHRRPSRSCLRLLPFAQAITAPNEKTISEQQVHFDSGVSSIRHLIEKPTTRAIAVMSLGTSLRLPLFVFRQHSGSQELSAGSAKDMARLMVLSPSIVDLIASTTLQIRFPARLEPNPAMGTRRVGAVTGP
ncbi:hypothetical protein [Sinorhizobium saheli]|uniref:hypothetical protein n=1 Tax=Sinorhizobium saheli TaxID=36856 RepID=UPI0012958E3A|nr:hypothetical protein [Sinorhizobium saheli]MQW89243.1 hypothetical protein [Sinorhizobium saheli]